MISWRRLQTLSLAYGSCAKRKGLREAYKTFSKEHLKSLKLGLKARSLKYDLLFGQAMAQYHPTDRQTFRIIKTAIRRDLLQINRDDCMDILDILTMYKCDGDEQDIMQSLKNYIENNAEEFEEQEISKFEDTLLLYHFDVKKLNQDPKIKIPKSKMSHFQKEMIRMKIPKPKFKYNFDVENTRLTIHDGVKKLKIIGIEHSVEWVELMRRELDNADGLILELEPMYGEAKTKQAADTEEDHKIKELIGVIRGVEAKQTEVKTNTPYLIRNVEKYLLNFEQSPSLVYHKGTKDVDEVRSLLKYVRNLHSVLLCDLSIDQQIILLARKISIQKLRQAFGMLRLMYINEQGLYLNEVAKKGCMKCGTAVLKPPYEIADQVLFPLNERDNFMAENIHHYIKSTDLKNYCCFVGLDHVLPIFKRLTELYNKDRWDISRNLEDIASYRPIIGQSEDKEQLVNKIALLESLYPRRLKSLPKELIRHRKTYQMLYDSYMTLLHPFPISCQV